MSSIHVQETILHLAKHQFLGAAAIARHLNQKYDINISINDVRSLLISKRLEKETSQYTKKWLRPDEKIPKEIEEQIQALAIRQRFTAKEIAKRLTPLEDGRNIPYKRIAYFLKSNNFLLQEKVHALRAKPNDSKQENQEDPIRNTKEIPEALKGKIISLARNLGPIDIAERIRSENKIYISFIKIHKFLKSENISPKRSSSSFLMDSQCTKTLFHDDAALVEMEVKEKINTFGKIKRYVE